VEVWVRVICFSWHPTNFIGFGLGLLCAPLKNFPRKQGAVNFFKFGFQLQWQASRWLGRVPECGAPRLFQKGGRLLVSGCGSSL